jgi:RHS repeat-associated protein
LRRRAVHQTLTDVGHNRYYQSALGRFVTPDPFGGSGKVTRPQSWNRYSYALADPTNLKDPSGLLFADSLDDDEDIGGGGGGNIGSDVGGVGALFTDFGSIMNDTGDYTEGPLVSVTVTGSSQGDVPLSGMATAVLSNVYQTTEPLTQLSTWSQITGLSMMAGGGVAGGMMLLPSASIPTIAAAAVGAGVAGEGAALRFSQTTASPWFQAGGRFAGQTISDVAVQLRSGTLAASDVPIQTVTMNGNTLIVNT